MKLKIAGSTSRTLPSFVAVLNVESCVRSAVPGIPSKKLYDLKSNELLAAFRQRLHDSERTPRFCRDHNKLTPSDEPPPAAVDRAICWLRWWR
jgi:hypothetical protein